MPTPHRPNTPTAAHRPSPHATLRDTTWAPSPRGHRQIPIVYRGGEKASINKATRRDIAQATLPTPALDIASAPKADRRPQRRDNNNRISTRRAHDTPSHSRLVQPQCALQNALWFPRAGR